MTRTFCIIGLTACASAALGGPTSFTPGHLYRVSTMGWVVESDLDLNEVRRFQVPGIADGVAGAMFNDRGEFLFIGRHYGVTKLLKIDAEGTVLDEFAIGGAVLGGSGIDFDPIRRRYAFADGDRITMLDEDLEPIPFETTGHEFDRVAGIEFTPDGRLFATDRFNTRVYEFDELGNLVGSTYCGLRPGDLDSGPNGELYVTNYNPSELHRVVPDTGYFEKIVGDDPFDGISDVAYIPDGTLVAVNDVMTMRRYTRDGVLLDSIDGFGQRGGGVAYFVPSPTGAVACVLASLLYCGRRRP